MKEIIELCRNAHRRTCPFYQNDDVCRMINEDKKCDMKCTYMEDFDELIKSKFK